MLKLIGPNAVGTVNDTETILISGHNVQTVAPQYINPVTITPDGLSITFQVAAGLNNLNIDLVSPAMKTLHVTFLSGGSPLRFATVTGGAGNCAIPILGQ